jgi:hypothetical protein
VVGGKTMEVFYWSIVGGIIGTVLVDLSGVIAKSMKFRWGG